MKTAYLFISITVILNVVAGTLAKYASVNETFDLAIAGIAMAVLGISFFTYRFSLKKIPISIAQSINSIKFALLIVVSFTLFNEQISLQQWCGIVLIFFGLFLVMQKRKI